MPASEASIPLTGGVSCEVWIERGADGREIVIKQALPTLKVAAEWRSNPERFDVEVRALAAIRELLGERVAPQVLWTDAVQHRFAMERVDARFRNWKVDLLMNRVDLTTAARVGELLGSLHALSSVNADVAAAFRNRDYFEELRIEPFFERVAKRNPPLANAIALAVADLRAPGMALVHGDFSPKNLLVNGADVVILDLEIAHWGNPRFDVAFCLSHLLLKGLRREVNTALFAKAARTFMDGYRKTGVEGVFDAQLVRMLGCLMLARFDGASPIDYREQVDEGRARKIAAGFVELPNSPGRDLDSAVEECLAK